MNSCCSKPFGRRAILLALLLLAACADTSPPPDTGTTTCLANRIPVTEIQGSGPVSPYVGSSKTVSGAVTLVAADSGFYIEEAGVDAGRQASKALFVSDAELADTVVPGQQIEISGTVAELGTHTDTLTALVDISHFEVCAPEITLPRTRVQLPLDPAEREALEGMRVFLDQPLTLTDVYNLARGQLTLSSNGVLRVPTEVVQPGLEAEKREAQNRSHSINATLPQALPAMAVGSTTNHVAGHMGHNGRGQQLVLSSLPDMRLAPLPDSPPPAGETTVRIVSFNLLNFFNGDGAGSGFPTERGAETLEAFQEQSARTQSAVAMIQPDLLAVQELENDGFGPRSTAQSLVNLLNATGHDDWAFVNAGPEGIGGDVITVGLFFRQDVLETIGPSYVLDRPPFRGLSRQPLAQLFRDKASGTLFLVAVNHLKSKGSCPEHGENADQGDGQGCWNRARVAAVQSEASWLKTLAKETGTENILVLGDMNAWRNEDPVRQFTAYGLVDLVETHTGLPQYSFLYWGQTGTLDYAFASAQMAGYSKQATIWHVNADWPANIKLPRPWLRSSDHDPVIVDFDFNQSSTSN